MGKIDKVEIGQILRMGGPYKGAECVVVMAGENAQDRHLWKNSLPTAFIAGFIESREPLALRTDNSVLIKNAETIVSVMRINEIIEGIQNYGSRNSSETWIPLLTALL